MTTPLKVVIGERIVAFSNLGSIASTTKLFNTAVVSGGLASDYTAPSDGVLEVQLTAVFASTVIVRRVGSPDRDLVQFDGASTVSLQTVRFKFDVARGGVYNMLLPGAGGADIIADMLVTFAPQRSS